MTRGGERAVIVIPARFASTRLPGKPLLDRTGKTLIQHVVEQARRVSGAAAVVVATDDERIASAVRAFGGEAVMTSPTCASGSDRVAEVMRDRDEDLVVNLQGDEPDFDPDDVDRLLAALRADPSLPMGTLAVPAEGADREQPSAVKVVCGLDGRALYFSRSGIPHERDPVPGAAAPAPVLRHVGIYAFRREAVLAFTALEPTPLERTEMLEQLRALENGWRIGVVRAARSPRGIDTPADYDAFCRRMAEDGSGAAGGSGPGGAA